MGLMLCDLFVQCCFVHWPVRFLKFFLVLVQFTIDVIQVTFYLFGVIVVLLGVLGPEFCGIACDEQCSYEVEVVGDRHGLVEDFLMAPSLSFLNLAMVLWSGLRDLRSQMSSILRLHSFSSWREDRIRFMYP